MSMKSFNVGDVLAAADLNEYCVNTHFAYKASGTTLTSHPSLANDPDLQIPVEANVIYEMWLEMPYTSQTAGLQVGFTAPSGTTLGGTVSGRVSGSFDATDLSFLLTLQYTGDATGTGVYYSITAHGLVNTAGTAGTLIVQWGQSSSSANGTTVRAGSCLSLRRVA